MSFAGPGLNKQVVPAFYAGARLFKARYTPTLPGTFQFALVDGSGVSFAGNASGVLQVVANSNPSAHGGVIVDSKHPHHFVYEVGQFQPSTHPSIHSCSSTFCTHIASPRMGAGTL